jgi:uncharacterized membrane protein (UPF0127 family)
MTEHTFSPVRARSAWSRLRGLIARPAPLPGHGLLIDRCRAVHTFGLAMAIDVVFLSGQLSVLSIRSRLGPCRVARCAWARATLEIAAGEARRIGLRPGDRIRFADGRGFE